MKITCGIYLYNVVTNKLLICHATRSKNGWSIPKGVKENDELPFEAASRELLEETNVDLHKINVLHVSELPPVNYKKQKKILYSFLVTTDSDFTNTILTCTSLVPAGYPEIDKICWETIENAKSLIHESQVANMEFIKKVFN